MQKISAVISMLHEPASPNSATRLFRQEPVLGWTLERVWRCDAIDSIAIICWQDQLDQVQPLASESEAHILCKNPRIRVPQIESIAASRRWADGWRGGLLGSCDFDLGFHASWVMEVVKNLCSDGIFLIDPSAGLVDPKLLAAMAAHAREHETHELFFTQAAPGLAGALLKPALIEKLAAAQTHPGRILSYLPEQPMRDPIAAEMCVPIPTPVARTTRTFRLDSDRQIEKLTLASVHLNGELVRSDSEDLVNRLKWTMEVDFKPREVVLELNTSRSTSPIFWPGAAHSIQRPALPVETARRIFDQLGDDIRLTLGGVGDPLLHEELFEIIHLARAAGIQAIHVETDLLPRRREVVDRLAEAEIDIVSMHLPAMTSATYATVMGVDRFTDAIENIRQFITRRQEIRRGVPILCPIFMKCPENLAEMEAWYDQWLKALGAAVISGPSDFAGLIPDRAVADMSPPKRKPCNRILSRMSILSDGRVVSCEQDVLGRQVMGDVNTHTIEQIWKTGFTPLRDSQRQNCGADRPVCAGCREWHRP